MRTLCACMVVAFLVLTGSARCAPKNEATKKTPATLGEKLEAARRNGGATVFYHSPPEPMWQTLREVARKLTLAAPSCDRAVAAEAESMLRGLGMELQLHQDGTTSFWLLREVPGIHQGRGVYLWRCGQATDVIVQAPHSFFDLKTGRLGRELFRDLEARVLMLNTLHRYKSRKGETPNDAEHPADVAHNDASLYQAVTVGILEAAPRSLFVQLHGFEAANRGLDVLLSDGRPDGQIMAPAMLASWQPEKLVVAVYGPGQPKLGGLTNVQGRAIRARSGRFLHVEMSPTVRSRLIEDTLFRRPFAEALRTLAAGPAEPLHPQNPVKPPEAPR